MPNPIVPFTRSYENIFMTLSLIIARFLTMPNLSLFDNAMTGSCQQLIRIIKTAKLFSLNNFPYEKHFFVEFFLNESYSQDLSKHIEIQNYEKRSILGWLIH